jgi:tRNA(adenine34) deaminase
MDAALELAKLSTEYNDVPVGAIIVHNDMIIGKGYNQIEKLNNSIVHAEIIAINDAINNYGYKHLLDCSIYVTLEPCAMCAGAIVLARISNLIYGANDPKTGACGSLFNIPQDERLNHRLNVISGVKKDECSQILKDFFKELRKTDNGKK